MRCSSCNLGWNMIFISVSGEWVKCREEISRPPGCDNHWDWDFNYFSSPNLCLLYPAVPIQIPAVIHIHLCMLEGQAASRTCSPCAHTWCCSGPAAGSRGHTEMSRCHRAPCCLRIASRWRGSQGHCRSSLSLLEVEERVRILTHCKTTLFLAADPDIDAPFKWGRATNWDSKRTAGDDLNPVQQVSTFKLNLNLRLFIPA